MKVVKVMKNTKCFYPADLPLTIKNSISAHVRLMWKHYDAYSLNHQAEDLTKAHYHFHVFYDMAEKKRILTSEEKREIFRKETNPRYG